MLKEQEINNVIDGLTKSRMRYRDYLEDKFSHLDKICVFGMGILGRGVIDNLLSQGLRVDVICDNDKNKIGQVYQNRVCKSLEELLPEKEHILFLIATVHYKEIYAQLTSLGIKNIDRIIDNKFEVDEYLFSHSKEEVEKHIRWLFSIVEDEESQKVLKTIFLGWAKNEYSYGQYDSIVSHPQYFEKGVIKKDINEVFVDAGAFDGDTLKDFITLYGEQFKRIILYEMNEKNFSLLEKNISCYSKAVQDKIVAYNLGLAEKSKKIRYIDKAPASSESIEGTLEAYTESLDNSSFDDITFIKMDIEGGEINALKGAKEVIRRKHPKLAICIYHRASDYWEIPNLIKKMVPEYKIYIRHYTDLSIETVCYAVI